MEQQVTAEDRLLIMFILELAEKSLGTLLMELDDGGASLSDTDMQTYNTLHAEQREKYNRGKEVLRKFG